MDELDVPAPGAVGVVTVDLEFIVSEGSTDGGKEEGRKLGLQENELVSSRAGKRPLSVRLTDH